MKKLHKFYKIVIDEFTGDKRYELYAITLDKYYAKEFMQTRDMKQFVHKMSKVTKEEGIEYCNIHRGTVLDIFKVDTKDVSNSGLIEVGSIDILGTMYERQIIDDDFSFLDINEEGFWLRAAPPFIFKRKYIKALKAVQYFQLWVVYNVDKLSPRLVDYYDIDPEDVPNVDLDQYCRYMDIFGDTYDLNNIKKKYKNNTLI